MNATAYTHVVKRDFTGGTNYTYVAGWFGSQADAEEFTTRLTGGGTWIIEEVPSLAALVAERDPSLAALVAERDPEVDCMCDACIAAASAAEAEELARQFAACYPTPQVLRAVALCEAGTLAWTDVAALFARSYGTARKEIGE